MSTEWKDIGFELEYTQDGSPTLRQLVAQTESMHHSGGAYSETEYIYTPQIQETLKHVSHPHFFILGLGLGYIELIIARESIKALKNPEDISISSYESDENLRFYFWEWLNGNPNPHNQIYDLILDFIEDRPEKKQNIKDFLLNNLKSFESLKKSFGPQDIPKLSSIHCYLYDAFSSKTNGELWTEDFLTTFFSKTSANTSYFSTYACTGNLKRALKNSGFTISVQKGFHGKRDYTKAIKHKGDFAVMFREKKYVEDGWLAFAKRVPSPNFFHIPNREVSLLVIHNISLPPNEYGGPYIDQLFTNRIDPNQHPSFPSIAHLNVASHLLIDRKGKITQYVPFQMCARHAGQSEFMGRPNCNEYSIGIELEGSNFEAFTDIQYEILGYITQLIINEYPQINKNRIVGHSDIAPGRKTDPGPFFDWKRYLNLIDK